MKKLVFLLVTMAMVLSAAAVNPDYQETVNGVTSNKIIVVGCRAAVGRVYNTGVYERGFVWATHTNPTVNDNYTNQWWYDDGNQSDGSTNPNSSSGTIYIMENLQPATRYYIRPYIRNSRNGTPTYGKEQRVWTLPAANWTIYGNWDHYGESGYEDQTSYIDATLAKHGGDLSWLTSCKQEAQDLFNQWTSFEKRVTVNFSEWEDGAHCSYGGDPSFGPGFTQNTGTMMHEIGHNLGVGTEWRYTSWDSPLHPTYLWTGERANRVFTLFQDRPDVMDENGNYTYGGNNTISDGDRVHVCYGLTGNINRIYRLRQAAYYEGMYEDGLSATGGGAGPYFSFDTDNYIDGSNAEQGSQKYYITNEDVATCNRYLCEENGKLAYRQISRSDLLNNNTYAWYVYYYPTKGFYYIKNASTGHYFTYGNDFGLSNTRNSEAEYIHLMASRKFSTINGQTLKAYWMVRGNYNFNPEALSASRVNQDAAAKAGFNLYDDAGYERWFILSADQVNAVGDVANNSENPGLEQITELPGADDLSKYFFIFTDHTRDLTVRLMNGNGNGGDYKAMWYLSRTDLRNDKNALWTLDYNEGGHLVTNAEYNVRMMQTEWDAPWNYRTHDDGGGDYSWGRTRFEYLNDGYWQIQNPKYDGNYLGPWNDGNFGDWQELACNKGNAEHRGNFNIYKLIRGEYVKYYQPYADATPGHPLDITYVLENVGAERRSTVGWKHEGDDWGSQTNDAFSGKVGDRYFERWNGGGVGNANIYQDIEGLPNGYYRFSAVATVNGNGQGFSLYANSEKAAVPTANDGTRTCVVVQVTDGNLRVGALAENVTAQWVAFDDCRLEYIGENVSAYNIGDPVKTLEDGNYFETMNTFDFDYIDAVTTDNTVAFTLLNSSAKVTLKKNGTTVAEGSVSLDGTKLTANFGDFTPELNTTYTLTLPAGVVGFAGHVSNSAITLTLHTPAIKSDIYFLRNDNGLYLSRGDWGGRAVMDQFGVAFRLETDRNGNTYFRFADTRQYLKKRSEDGYCWTDEDNRDYALKMMIEPQGNGVYLFRYKEILNGSDRNCLAIWDGNVICDCIPGSHSQGNTYLWTLETFEAHKANYTRNADAQAAALGITGVSTWAQLETQMRANYSGETVFTDVTDVQDHWRWGATSEHYKHELTDLANGIYRLTISGFQRPSHWDWMWEVDNTSGMRGVAYLYAGDQKTQLMGLTEEGATYSDTGGMHWHNNLCYPDNTASAGRAFDAGHYKNYVYVKVTNGSLTFGIADPSGIPDRNHWIAFRDVKVERMVSGLMGLEAEGITDGGYIGSPITSVTLKPLNTTLTNVTIASGTKVTIYKDGTQIQQVTPTKSGANIVVALPTLENGATYRLTLDEKKLTYNNNSQNAAFEVTFKTPAIYDGTYYLCNVRNDDFIQRSGNEVYTTFLGQSVTWTNGANGATIKFNDGETNSYLGGRWYSSANESEGNALRWEATLYNGAYKLNSTNPVDDGWNYLYANEGGNGDHVASNGRCKEDDNDNNNFDTWANGTALWKFMTEAEYAAYVRTLDEVSGVAPSSGSDVKVYMKRTMKANGTWNTVCFPFAMTSDQIVEQFGAFGHDNGTYIKELSSVNMHDGNASLKFSEVTAIEANKPYIMKVGAEKSEFYMRHVTLEPTDAPSATVDAVTFKGNYVYPTVIPEGDFYITSNKFYSSPGGTKLKGFRGYFHVNPASGIKSLNGEFDADDNIDDLVGIEDCQLTMNNEQLTIFDLSGRRVHRPSKGFYIVNGKKMFIK